MDIQITPRPLSGSVTPPPSKSLSHRLLLAAALSAGSCTLTRMALSRDIEATLRCIEALGTRWEQPSPDTLVVHGIGGTHPVFSQLPRFDCGESGSTLRFLIPIALAVAGGGVFTGQGRLMERPQQPYFDLFRQKGISFSQENGVLTVQGRLTPGDYALPGNVSSQFFTGLLYALPLLAGPSTLRSTTVLESIDYISMSLRVLREASVNVRPLPEGDGFSVSPSAFRMESQEVEADWSQAGFWYAARQLGNNVAIHGMDAFSTQGDKAVADLCLQLAEPGEVELDLADFPDLVPPLAVMAALRPGTARFTGIGRLRLKESDRIRTTAAAINALGGQVEEGPDFLVIHGVAALTGGTVDGANDHRIVMAAAIAATRCAGPVTILGAEAVQKSYPRFFEEYQRLGGVLREL